MFRSAYQWLRSEVITLSYKYPKKPIQDHLPGGGFIMLKRVRILRANGAGVQLVMQRKWLSNVPQPWGKKGDGNYGQYTLPARSRRLILICRPLKESFIKQYIFYLFWNMEISNCSLRGDSSRGDEKAPGPSRPNVPRQRHLQKQ